MGGKFRPAVLAVSALALLAIASPVAVITGPLAAHQVAAATGDAKHAGGGGNHDVRDATPATSVRNATSAAAVTVTPAADSDAATKPRAGQPSERADHASAASRGLHVGAGDDRDEGAGSPPVRVTSSSTASAGTPTAGTQGASTPAVATTSTNHSGGTSAPPPGVIVAPPAAPQTNPPIAAQPGALTGARLDWILVGVVVALAAAVVAAVRVATFRGRRPPR